MEMPAEAFRDQQTWTSVSEPWPESKRSPELKRLPVSELK
jgi:hypothetical protein